MIETQIFIIRIKRKISILELQISKMEFALLINEEKEKCKRKGGFVDYLYSYFRYKYSNCETRKLRIKIESKKEQLISYRILLETLQNKYAQKKEKSRCKKEKRLQRIKDIILTLSIEKLFDYGMSFLPKKEDNKQIIIYQQINRNGDNYFIQQNNIKEYNIVVQGIPFFIIAILIYFLRY